MDFAAYKAFSAFKIEQNDVKPLVVKTKDLCQILKDRAESFAGTTEQLQVMFDTNTVTVVDSRRMPYDLPGYRFCLLEYTDYPSARVWLSKQLIEGSAALPTIKGKPALYYLWNRYGLIAPLDFEQHVSLLPVDADGAYVYDNENCYRPAANKLKGRCPHERG